MAKGEPDLLNNGLLAAVQLDVLNMETLPEGKKEKARDAVVNLVLRLKGLKDEEEEVGSSSEGSSELSDVDSDVSDANLEILRKNLSQEMLPLRAAALRKRVRWLWVIRSLLQHHSGLLLGPGHQPRARRRAMPASCRLRLYNRSTTGSTSSPRKRTVSRKVRRSC
jgi:hypothetical protein